MFHEATLQDAFPVIILLTIILQTCKQAEPDSFLFVMTVGKIGEQSSHEIDLSCTEVPCTYNYECGHGCVLEGQYSGLEVLSASRRISPCIHLDLAHCGFEEFEYSRQGFSSKASFLLHTISPLIATEIIYWYFTNDDSQSRHSRVWIFFYTLSCQSNKQEKLVR